MTTHAPATIALTSTAAPQSSHGSARGDPWEAIYSLAQLLDDLEGVRIANENRVRALAEGPDAMILRKHADHMADVEHQVTLSLNRAMRTHPLAGWVKRTRGAGEKTLARLLAEIGPPELRESPSQLWAYCGLHVWNDPGQWSHDTQSRFAGVAPHRTRGEKGNWNTKAKTRVYLVAEACVKTSVRKLESCDDSDGYDVEGRKAIGHYGQVYLDGRAKYADATHAVACRRCGPKGSPALPGSDLSDGHKHARAMRLVMKAILLDLWKEARAVSSQTVPDTHRAPAD